MKKSKIIIIAGLMIIYGITSSTLCSGQVPEEIEKYFMELPSGNVINNGIPQKYRMTSTYTNRDLYGNFTGRIKVTGDYTWGLENGHVSWNNVFIANSDKPTGPFAKGSRQDYMENFKYIPSPKMLDAEAFKDFPPGTESVFAKNLIWDMMSIETFVWEYSDSLRLNIVFVIPDNSGEFSMAGIGNYEHTGIQLCRTGISVMNNVLCDVIEYRAIDNKIELIVDPIKTRGTEQYWGTVWIAHETRQIEHAEMYSGTIQEIEIKGFTDKFLSKTIRDLRVERIN